MAYEQGNPYGIQKVEETEVRTGGLSLRLSINSQWNYLPFFNKIIMY